MVFTLYTYTRTVPTMRHPFLRSIFRLCFFALLAGSLSCGSCDEGAVNINNASDAALNPDTDGGATDGGATDASDTAPDDVGDADNSDTDAQTCATNLCGGQCCGSGQECVEDQCLAACMGTRCGDDFGLCCTGSQLCLGGGCVVPGDDCERTEDCPVNAICEPTAGKCVPRDAVEVCEFVPPVGQFTPEIDCAWPPANLQVDPNRDRVVVTPVVGNLTDDNGDGLTNTDDIPDIAFLSRTGGCCNNPATLRIISGQCKDDGSTTEIASLNSAQMINDGALALGDLTGNGVPELVAISHTGNADSTNNRETPQGAVAWTRTADDGSTWEVLWRNETYPTKNVHSNGGATIGLADLDGNGEAEVIVGNVVLNGQTGALKWDGNVTSGGSGGIGNNAFLGPASAVGDVDLDGNQEVAAGNTLYDFDGTVLWTYQYTGASSGCQGNLGCDGFNAIANFDSDPEAEIVIVRSGDVYVLNHDGTLVWKKEIPRDDCSRNESGPPTVADFDGDGRPEIGTAGADFYAVMDMDCDPATAPGGTVQQGCDSNFDGVLWAKPNQDCSSRATASSVFDFEGDGKAEMVYADEDTFRIRAGADGTLLYEDATHNSNTRIEMPVVADVDNDGNSEVVIPSDTNKALKIWGDSEDNWVRTRRIWNQHGYSVTNINEDGSIPAQPQANWQNGRLNNYRQNTQPGGVFDAPDLAVESIGLGGACTGAATANVTVTVANRGALGEPAGIPVNVVVEHNGNTTAIATLQTTQRLLPGQTETLSTTWTIPSGFWQDGFVLRAAIDPDGQINECDETNNELDGDSASLGVSQAGLVVDTLDVVDFSCGNTREVTVDLSIENASAATIAADVPILIEAQGPNSTDTVATVRTQGALAPGETEQLSVDWMAPASYLGGSFSVTATVDADGEVFDCDVKNTATASASCIPDG
jgi:hypothetical protein